MGAFISKPGMILPTDGGKPTFIKTAEGKGI